MAAVNAPPPHLSADQQHAQFHSRSSEQSTGQQDHRIGQDPAPQSHPQHHLPPRPVYYVQAPPHPPFMPYQWPFPYNPFMGFPGMGYGMVVPPFMPPPPYMDAPAYIMPHPHLQPVDYRRFFQPPVHPSMAHHQNPYQTRRVRPQQPVLARETVNSEVQTEPPQRSMPGYNSTSPLTGSDSGQGTAQSSPSSSSSHKHYPEGIDPALPNSNASDAVEGKRGDVRSNVVESIMKPSLEMQMGQFGSVIRKNGHLWSVSSTESLNPVCNSSRREEVTGKERRLSVPDILLSWGSGPRQADTRCADDKILPQNDLQLPCYETEVEGELAVYSDPAEKRDDCTSTQASPTQRHEDQQGSKSSEATLLVDGEKHVLTKGNCTEPIQEGSQDDYEINTQDDTSEGLSFTPFSLYYTKPKMGDESVWSVESLALYVPSKEWMLQNSTSEMLKVPEEPEKKCDGSPKNDELVTNCNPDTLFSSMSPPITSTPPSYMHRKNAPSVDAVCNTTQDFPNDPKDYSNLSPAALRPKKNTEENDSSEPEGSKTPNQECTILTEHTANNLKADHLCEGQCNHSNPLSEPHKQQEQQLLIVPTVDQHNVSPSKRDLVDCGVQCTELQFCPCQETTRLNGRHMKQKVVRVDDGEAEGVCMNGNRQKQPKRQNQWKNRRQEKHGHQQEFGFHGKIKSRSGVGKNPCF